MSPAASPPTLSRALSQHRNHLLEMLDRRIDRSLRVRVDAEDVFQRGCVAAKRRWPEFADRPDGELYVWLYGIMRDQLIEVWREQTRGPRDLRRDEPMPDRSADQLCRGFIAPGPGPQTDAERNELRQRVRNVLELLDDDDFEVIKLRQFEGRSFAQVAEMLRVTENAATVRYVRALKKLKGVWDALYAEDV